VSEDRAIVEGALPRETETARAAHASLRRLRGAAGYNSFVLMLGRAQLVTMLVILVVAFASFHPYFDAAGLCGLSGCPDVSQSSHAAHASFSTTCLIAVLAASPVALAFTLFFGRRRAAYHSEPTEMYLSPDPPPPRKSPSH
jgi:hypothetical protein